MWLSKKRLKAEYDMEVLKQSDPYQYYLDSNKKIEKSYTNEGVHENVPLICIKREDIKPISEDDRYSIYEYDEYYLYVSKLGQSSVDEMAELLTNAIKSNADLIYSDIDHITCDGKRHTPFYKMDYSLDTFRCFDYYSEFYAVKKNKSKMDIATYETISHVTKPLFHYKCEENEESLCKLHSIKNACYQTDEFYLSNGVCLSEKDEISIIIPSKDNPSLINTCLSGIKNAKIKSGINTLEVVIIDNGSTEEHKKEITDVIKRTLNTDSSTDSATSSLEGIYCADGLTVKYIYEQMEFNFSKMCNIGAKEASGKYFLFMNDDIEITDELFMLKLLYFAKMDHIGAVGCKLLYPGEERRIQHIGITCLKYPGPSHKLSTFPDDKLLYFGMNRGIHNVSAVTGACLMLSGEKYFKIGGFHDKMKVGYNDVDLCLSLYEMGYLNLVNTDCTLIHHESITRGADAESEEKLNRLSEERNLLYERHSWLLDKGDPYYNPNLAQDFLDYRVNVIPDFERRDYVSRTYSDPKNRISKLADSLAEGSKKLLFNIESISENSQYITVNGWAFVSKKDGYLFDTYLVMKDELGKTYAYETTKVKREDLTTVFPNERYIEISGFMAKIENVKGLKLLGIALINKQTGKKYYAGYKGSDI